MIEKDQGEVAVIFEIDKSMNITIQDYCLPKRERFSPKQLRNAYLAKSLHATQNDKKAQFTLYNFLHDTYDEEKPSEGVPSDSQYAYQTVEVELDDRPPHLRKPRENGEKVEKPKTIDNFFKSIRMPKTFKKTKSLGTLKRIENIEKTKTVDDTQRSFYSSVSDSLPTLGCNPKEPVHSVYKYKPVAKKVRPIVGELPQHFRIVRKIEGDPLKDMPELSRNPPDFTPTGRYTQERKEVIDNAHAEEFLWPEERKLLHHFMMVQEKAFAWNDEERGKFREDFFPPVEMPVVPHTPWVQKNIPIPPGTYDEVCKVVRTKIEAGVFEPSNSSYRSRWFGVLKKDGKSIRIVQSLEPLNAVTIQHSGLPPATDELAEQFAGYSCGAILDMYVGYDERTLAESSRDLTTFQTPYGALRLTTLPMGWTNSVPIFHDDVTYMLREEIPHVTRPYIDDVPIKGPKTRYELPDGGYGNYP